MLNNAHNYGGLAGDMLNSLSQVPQQPHHYEAPYDPNEPSAFYMPEAYQYTEDAGMFALPTQESGLNTQWVSFMRNSS